MPRQPALLDSLEALVDTCRAWASHRSLIGKAVKRIPKAAVVRLKAFVDAAMLLSDPERNPLNFADDLNALRALRRELNESNFEAEDCRMGAYCKRHGFIHGLEAEELRRAFEQLVRDAEGDSIFSGQISQILDEVDARDSVCVQSSGA